MKFSANFRGKVFSFVDKKRAERVGFEPTIDTRSITVFETAPFNRSGISPNRKGIIHEEWGLEEKIHPEHVILNEVDFVRTLSAI